MKKKLTLLMFLMSMGLFLSPMLKAQTDAYFSNYSAQRTEQPGLTFNVFSGGANQEGLAFNGFSEKENVPVGNGIFLMTTSGLLYLITKRRKED